LPGEAVSFKIEIQNTTGAPPSPAWYINVVITNQATGQELGSYPTVSTVDTPGNSSVWYTTDSYNWTAVQGLYTVSIILYNESDVKQHQIWGSEPIDVGRTEESVSAFPNIIDLGVIPYGRYMYPNPIKIHWDFYLSNRLRKDQPWYMRIYTDNAARYKGIEGAIYGSRKVYTTSKIRVAASSEGGVSGLVSSDGKHTLPLKVWCLNFGPDWDEIGWNPTLLGPPPVNDDYVWIGPQLDNGKRDTDRSVWMWIPDYSGMSADKRTWRRLIGQDPYDNEFVTDNNPTGDFTLDSPFDIYLATETSSSTVIGKYTGKLIVEIYTP